MPKPTILLDYQRCDPDSCEGGICAAAVVCERKVLRQEAPGEMPAVYPTLCLACIACIAECPHDAIRQMK